MKDKSTIDKRSILEGCIKRIVMGKILSLEIFIDYQMCQIKKYNSFITRFASSHLSSSLDFHFLTKIFNQTWQNRINNLAGYNFFINL